MNLFRIAALCLFAVFFALTARADALSPGPAGSLEKYVSEAPDAAVWVVEVTAHVEGPHHSPQSPFILSKVRILESLYGKSPEEAVVYRSVSVEPDCAEDSPCKHAVTPYALGKKLIIVTSDCSPEPYRCAAAPGWWEFPVEQKEEIMKRIKGAGKP